VTTPRLTISVLVYGPSPFLHDTLDSLAANTTVDHELLLVDHGTNEETRARMAEVDGARVVRPAKNLGFGAGHTFAANLARGTYFCALNSDAVVPSGWAEALIAPLERDARAGATMPVFVYPDGRLQEAGATIEPSGQVIAFGRFDDPERDEYQLSGRVPFATAACVVTRLDTFRSLRGFDARYGLAYYEDVDFAFALLARGMHVELVTTVRVVHAQGASSETQHDAERLLLGNRGRFRSRWAPFLAGRPYVYARAEAHHLVAARDFDVCDRMLLVAAELPPLETVLSLARALRDGRVTVTAAATVSADERRAWLHAGIDVIALDALDATLLARRFHYAAVALDPSLAERVEPLVRSTQPQAAVTAMPDAAGGTAALARWIGSIGLAPLRAPELS
jgi:GT2 family glycosyltransferase